MAKKPKAMPKARGEGGYPYDPLIRSLKLGSAVSSHGGRDVPKALISQELRMGVGASGFNQLCASAKVFGIVEGSRDLSLTDKGRDYFHPTTESSQRRAMLEFFATPPIFAQLIRQYDGGKMPSTHLVANVLQRNGVPPSWAARVAGMFFATASDLGVVDEHGFLRYSANVHVADRGGPAVQQSPQHGEPQLDQSGSRTAPAPRHYTMQAETGHYNVTGSPASNVWTYSEAGGSVRLETASPLPRALWERLAKYVAMLEPSESQGGSTNGST